LALGGKIIWQLYANKKHPVSKILQMKYLKGGSLRNLTIAATPTGTTIWNLSRRCTDHLQQHLYIIQGNVLRTLLLEDIIQGNAPLASLNSYNDLKIWLVNKGLLRLADIFSCDSKGNWAGWTFPGVPEPLHTKKNLLYTALSGLAPVHCSSKDKWGWGRTGIYTTAQVFPLYNLLMPLH